MTFSVKEFGASLIKKYNDNLQRSYEQIAEATNDSWIQAVGTLIEDEGLRNDIGVLAMENLLRRAMEEAEKYAAKSAKLEAFLAGKLSAEEALDLIKSYLPESQKSDNVGDLFKNLFK